MSRIAKRLWGEPIPYDAEVKIRATEAAGAGKFSFLDSQGQERQIDQENTSRPGPSGYYSALTPFARMWTAVSVVELGTKEEDKKKYKSDEITGPDDLNFQDFRYKFNPESEEGADDAHIEEIKITRTPSDKLGKVYMLGSYNARTKDRGMYEPQQDADFDPNSVLPNQRETYTDSDFFSDTKRLKPIAGITSVRSSTKNHMGPLSGVVNTSVEFKVYDFEEYDSIYSRYFLRPGAPVYVDFGWASDERFKLYNPEDLLANESSKRGTYNEIIYGEISGSGEVIKEGQIHKSNYDCNFVQGYVTNARSDLDASTGAWNCSIEILSANSLIANPSLIEDGLTGDAKKNLLASLEYRIIKLASEKLFKKRKVKGKDDIEVEVGLFPDENFSTDDEKNWGKIADSFAADFLNSPDFNIPTDINTQTGVYWRGTFKEEDNPDVEGEKIKIPSTTADAIYISYGFFEDLILNQEFGKYFDLGDKELPFISDKVEYDSTNCYTKWSKTLFLRQKYFKSGNVSRKLPFLFPQRWDDTFNTKKGKSLSAKKTAEDKLKGRIPVREVFISLKLIKQAISEAEELDEVFNRISKEFAKSTGDAWDWQMESTTLNNGTLGFVDLNYIGGRLYSDASSAVDKYENLYDIKPYSEETIVKNLSISMNLGGSDAVTNKLALTGLGSGGRTAFPVSQVIDQMQSLEIIENGIRKSFKDPNNTHLGTANVEIEYVPSTHWGEVQKQILKDAGIITPLEVADPSYLSSQNIYSDQGLNIDQTKFDAIWKQSIEKRTEIEDQQADPRQEPSEVSTWEWKQEKLLLEKKGFWFSDSVIDYFTDMYILEHILEKPTVLPLQVNLSVFGINAFLPGDIFDIGFLPVRYRDLVMFQVTGIEHNISPGEYTTNLSCIMRFREDKKGRLRAKEGWTNRQKKVISPYVLKSEFNLTEIGAILPFLRFIKPIIEEEQHLNYEYAFKINTMLSGKTQDITQLLTQSFGDYSGEGGKQIADSFFDLIKDTIPAPGTIVKKISSDGKVMNIALNYTLEPLKEYYLFTRKDKWVVSSQMNDAKVDEFFALMEKSTKE